MEGRTSNVVQVVKDMYVMYFKKSCRVAPKMTAPSANNKVICLISLLSNPLSPSLQFLLLLLLLLLLVVFFDSVINTWPMPIKYSEH